ncbi:MAG: cytochrome P460 family protein [Desulfobacterales bacterium]|nr:cytochrome P460 family protein [Desulfobacterales bacterium]
MKKRLIMALLMAGFLLTGATVYAAPFGNPDDVAYAETLWNVLVKFKLAGRGMINSVPYTGQDPHGAILESLDRNITVNGHTGAVIVKRNYGGKDVSKAAVANNPAKYLMAVTVMFKRERGYDPENKDWFWAKFKPDGSLDANPKGMKLAGRVAKGMPQGCIACHKAAQGGDYVFGHDRFVDK